MATDREKRIRQLAQGIWDREGRPEGRDEAHWQEATALYEAERAGVSGGKAPAKGRGKAAVEAAGKEPAPPDEWTFRIPGAGSPEAAPPKARAQARTPADRTSADRTGTAPKARGRKAAELEPRSWTFRTPPAGGGGQAREAAPREAGADEAPEPQVWSFRTPPSPAAAAPPSKESEPPHKPQATGKATPAKPKKGGRAGKA